MAQTPAVFRQTGDYIDYTPNADVAAGAVVVLGNYLVAIAIQPIASGALGALCIEGTFNGPKVADAVVAGTPLYWDDNGSPVGGTALSGALTSDSTKGPFAGFALETAGGGVGDVDFSLRSVDSVSVPGSFADMPTATVAAAGAAQGNAAAVDTGFSKVTGADGVKGVILPTAAAGKVCLIKNAATAPLLVYPNTADAINAGAANAAYNMAANNSTSMLVALDATTWYTFPLVAA
jgi:predicted RecA/RadA family phage recombinase